MATVIKEWWLEANVGKASSADQARKNVQRLKSSFYQDDNDEGGNSPVLGLCEWDEGGSADHGDEHGMARDTWPNYSWAHFNTMVPVGFSPDHWELEYAKLTPTHPGKSGVTYDRPINEARLRRKGADWCVVHVLSSHAVNGAFTNPDQGHERDRRDFWFWWWGCLRTRIRQIVSNGDAWVFMADTNRPDMPKVHDKEKRWVEASLDYVIGGDGDHLHFKHIRNRKIDLNIDGHNGHAALVEMHKV